MIDRSAIVETVIQRLKKLAVGHCIDIRSYKRNRSVVIVKQERGDFLVIEDGFEKRRFQIAPKDFRSFLKKLIRREFPRSNKLRLYTLGIWGETETVKRKKT